jgi:hypothetical protein
MKPLFFGLAFALLAGPAPAQIVGHICREEARFGEGWVSAWLDQPLRKPAEIRIDWTPRPAPPGAWTGLVSVRIEFERPPPGQPVSAASRVLVEYGVRGPSETLWVMVRMGEALRREAIYLPAPYRFPRERRVAGYGRTVVLPGVAQAFAAGWPLEVYLVSGDGRVVERHVLPLAERTEALQAVNRLWPDIERKSADPARLCPAQEVIELS